MLEQAVFVLGLAVWMLVPHEQGAVTRHETEKVPERPEATKRG